MSFPEPAPKRRPKRATPIVRQYEKLLAEGDYYHAYQLYIKSPMWERRRKQVLKRDGYRCRACWKTKDHDGVTLQVHHAHYVKHLFYDDIVTKETLYHVTLCKDCHEDFEESKKRRKAQ